MKRLVCIALFVAGQLSAQPIDGQAAVELVRSAMLSQGQAPPAMVPPQRPLPPCGHAPTVRPFQGRWTAAELVCERPVRWRRVLRIDAVPAEGRTAASPDRAFPAPVVLVAASPLPRGHRIAPADLVAGPASGVDPAQAIVLPRDAVGRRLRTAVGAGMPVLERHLEAELAVEAGQRVGIVAQGAGLAVAFAGEALEGGGIGDVIRVRAGAGGRVVEAEVSGPQRVMVRPKLAPDAAVIPSKMRSP